MSALVDEVVAQLRILRLPYMRQITPDLLATAKVSSFRDLATHPAVSQA